MRTVRRYSLDREVAIARRTIWLPSRWRQHELGRTVAGRAIPCFIRRVRWVEKHSLPRWAVLIGLVVILEDFAVFVIGVVIGTGGTVLFVAVGAATVWFFQRLV